MSAVEIIESVLSLVAGVGVFLIACTMMSSNLEALASGRLKALFAKTTKNKLVGVGVGAAATAVIQSSSATSVMVIGFVNAGIMSLTQAATVIFGANIGTTITGQLVALGLSGGDSVSTSIIFATLAGVGAFVLAFAKRDRTQKIGGILAGFGMLFVGLSMMSGSMEQFSALDEVKNFLAQFQNPLLLALIGTLLTAIIQSSSAMTSITIAMVTTVAAGSDSALITLNQGIYITMGANIGTCVTAMLAGLTSTKNAKRTALVHLIFNVSGVVVFMLIGLFMSFGGVDYGWLFEKMFPNAPQLQLAMFHTIFNVVTVIIVLPLTSQLVRLVTKILPDSQEDEKGEGNPHLYYVEEHMLKNPPVAVQQTKREVINMAQTALVNFDIAIDIICTLDYSKVEMFRKNEMQLNYSNSELAKFIAKLLKADLSEKDRLYLSTAFRAITDLERVGDYAENIIENADKLKAVDQSFTQSAKNEIYELQKLIHELYDSAMKAYSEHNKKALNKAYEIEEKVDDFTAMMTENHIKRMDENICTPEVGAQYLSLSASAERIADHYINVCKSIKSF